MTGKYQFLIDGERLLKGAPVPIENRVVRIPMSDDTCIEIRTDDKGEIIQPEAEHEKT